jgi:hypothetical protein
VFSDDSEPGVVRVLQYSSGAWAQLGSDLCGAVDGDDFGNSVALSSDGSILAVGAKSNGVSGSYDEGYARVYQYSGSSWLQMGGDLLGEASGDNFGSAVSISSDGMTVASGGIKNTGSGNSAGHVRVYQYSGSSWSQMGSDIDAEASKDRFGGALSLSSDGSILAVGASRNAGSGTDAGHVRVLEFSGSSWSQRGGDIDAEAAGDFYGEAVSLSDDGCTLAVGGRKNDAAGTDSGHVRVLQYTGGSWVQMGADLDGEASGDYFGTSVALSGDGLTLVVGATLNDGASADAGHIRIYQYSSNSWSQLGDDIEGEGAGDYFGVSTAVSSNGAIVAAGGYFNDDAGTDAGHVRVFGDLGIALHVCMCTKHAFVQCKYTYPCTRSICHRTYIHHRVACCTYIWIPRINLYSRVGISYPTQSHLAHTFTYKSSSHGGEWEVTISWS